jgi:large subunit ribosomal protein L21
MYAVIQTGGKQYRVTEGQVLRVEKLDDEVGSKISIDAAFVATDDAVHVGTPLVKGAKVKATVVDIDRGPKVIAFKKKRRKGYKRRIGHRQTFTALKIDEIVMPKKRAAKKKAESEEGEE